MIAQDTGSAITGPARADLYFGAGPDAGRVSGRLRHNMRFVMLVPKSLDPMTRARKMPVPDARPSERIAELFPQTDPLKDQPKDQRASASTAQASKDAPKGAEAAQPVPLPEARPNIKPGRDEPRRHTRYRRRGQ
jgi:membrane-bound lytic murein transglycosylase A